MSNLSEKQMRNSRSDYYNASQGGAVNNDYNEDFDNWAPRRTCQMCKKQFRTDKKEGFSDFMVDICSSCIHKLVKDAKSAQKKDEKEVLYRRRIDEISPQ